MTQASGVWTFTPASGFTGAAIINYTITDADGATASSTHTVAIGNVPPTTIDPVPGDPLTPFIDPLDAENIIVPAVDNVALTFPVASYFTDANGDPLTITPTLTGLPAWLTYNATTKTFSGTPPVDNTGSDVVIPVNVTDGKGGSLDATVTIKITNPAPVANPQTITTPFNTAVVVDLAGNDTDADGDPLSVNTATLAVPANGTLTQNPTTKVWTFTPAAGFTGNAVINYTVTDQDGATSTSTHTVTVQSNTNQPPIPVDPPATNVNLDPSGKPLVLGTDNVLLTYDLATSFSDPDGDALTFTPTLTGMPAWLTYNAATHMFSGTPPVDNAGADIVVPVTVDDGKGGILASQVTFRITNPAPVAVAQTVTTPFNTAVVVDLAANDTDPDGDPLSVNTATLAVPANGTLTQNPTTKVWTFTPAAGFTGNAVINYTVTDQDGATSTSTHTVTVQQGARPIAVNDIYTTAYDTPVNGDVKTADTFMVVATFSMLTQPMNGSIAFRPDGTFLYTPNQGFIGTESFAYQVTDATGQSAFAFESIRVLPPSLIAVSDAEATNFDTAISSSVDANDTFNAGSTFFAITAPQHGTVAMNDDGTYVYTPTAGYFGSDMFAYAVTDTAGQTKFAAVNITVRPPPGPVAEDDAYSTNYTTAVSGNAATGDSFASGSTFEATTTPGHGSLVFRPDGTYVYTPASGFTGVDTFEYRITDVHGFTDIATERITVRAPILIAVDDSYSGIAGQPISGNAAGSDTFASGSTFQPVGQPSHGTVTMNANGTFLYVPSPEFTGTDTFTYRVTDPTGQSAIATETIVITPPELVAANDQATTKYNVAVSADVSINDRFAAGSRFTIEVQPTVGTVVMNADGKFTYQPPAGFSGVAQFTYRVTDPTGQWRTALQSISVSPPILIGVNDQHQTLAGSPLDANVGANNSYVPGSIFRVTGTAGSGLVTMNSDGTYRYSPRAGYVGTDIVRVLDHRSYRSDDACRGDRRRGTKSRRPSVHHYLWAAQHQKVISRSIAFQSVGLRKSARLRSGPRWRFVVVAIGRSQKPFKA